MDARNVMIAVAFAFYPMVAGTVGNSSLPYEDNPDNFKHQRFSEVTNSAERLYVRSRTFNTTTKDRCHSAEKISNRDGNLLYRLRLRPEGFSYLLHYDTNMHTLATPNHTENNAAGYRLRAEYPNVVRKLMYIDPNKKCFILVETIASDTTGCQLVQTASTVDGAILQDCQDVYKKNCPGDKVELYEKECKNLKDYLKSTVTPHKG